MPSRRFKIVVGVMAALTVATYLVEPYVGARSSANLKPAPDFSLATIDNSTFHLSEHNNGSVVIIDFMAVWCEPCKAAVGELARLRMQNDASKVVIVSVDVAVTETPAQLDAFRFQWAGVNSTSLPAGWYFAIDHPSEYVGPKYGANALPTVVLVDLSHNIRQSWVGVVHTAELHAAVDEALHAGA